MARLTAKLEAHEDHADELAANRKIQARYDATPQGEQMQRAELRFHGAFKRSIAAFHQYRKEKKNAGELNDEGGLAPSPAKADDKPWVAEVEVAERPGPRRKPRTRGRRPSVADPGPVYIQATAGDSQWVAGVELAPPASPRRRRRPTAEIKPVEPKPVVELASAKTKMTSEPNLVQPENAGELASLETKMTSEPNLVQPENAVELASPETKMTSEPNLVRPENAGELASKQKKMTSKPNLARRRVRANRLSRRKNGEHRRSGPVRASDRPRPTAEIEPVEPKPVGELASKQKKMTSKPNLARRGVRANQLSRRKTARTANLARSERAGEPSKEEKNCREEDIPPTKALRSWDGAVNLKAHQPTPRPAWGKRWRRRSGRVYNRGLDFLDARILSRTEGRNARASAAASISAPWVLAAKRPRPLRKRHSFALCRALLLGGARRGSERRREAISNRAV